MAARLGALSLYDQTGQLMFADGFENGLAPFSLDPEGAGSSIALRAGHSFFGGYSCVLTGGSDGLALAHLSKSFARPFLTRWGVEARAVLNSANGVWLVNIRRYDGTYEHKWEVRVDLSTNAITLLRADGTYVTIAANSGYQHGPDIWHPLKLVADLATDAYVRLGFATLQFDISAYSARLSASPNLDSVDSTIGANSVAGSNAVVEIDSLIYTYNEP